MKSLALWLACIALTVAFGALAASLNNETADAQAQADNLADARQQARVDLASHLAEARP